MLLTTSCIIYAQFETFSTHVLEVVDNKLHGVETSITDLSIAVTANSINLGASWPNVTISHFHLRTREALQRSGADMLIFAPSVQFEERAAWQAYADESKGWLDDSARGEGVNDIGEFPPHIRQFDGGAAVVLDNVPIWQVAPLPSNASLFLQDLNTLDWFRHLAKKGIDSDGSVISTVIDADFILQYYHHEKFANGNDRDDDHHDEHKHRNVQAVQPDNDEHEMYGNETSVGEGMILNETVEGEGVYGNETVRDDMHGNETVKDGMHGNETARDEGIYGNETVEKELPGEGENVQDHSDGMGVFELEPGLPREESDDHSHDEMDSHDVDNEQPKDESGVHDHDHERGNDEHSKGESEDHDHSKEDGSDDDHHEMEVTPHSFVLQPVYREFEEADHRGHEDHSDSDFVGFVLALVSWGSYFQNILPNSANGFVAVVEDTCGEGFTYEINGKVAHFVGFGDRHNSKYDNLKNVYVLDMFEKSGAHGLSEEDDSGAHQAHIEDAEDGEDEHVAKGGEKEGHDHDQLEEPDKHTQHHDDHDDHDHSGDDDSDDHGDNQNFGSNNLEQHCHYSVHIYASDALRDTYETSKPLLYAFVVLLVFVFTAGVFLIYDYSVQRRQSIVLATAQRTTAIVSSLFPKSVQERLLKDAEEHGKLTTGHGKKTGLSFGAKSKLKDFLGENRDGDPENDNGKAENSTSIHGSAPIADLFPEATIMFAGTSRRMKLETVCGSLQLTLFMLVADSSTSDFAFLTIGGPLLTDIVGFTAWSCKFCHVSVFGWWQ